MLAKSGGIEGILTREARGGKPANRAAKFSDPAQMGSGRGCDNGCRTTIRRTIVSAKNYGKIATNCFLFHLAKTVLAASRRLIRATDTLTDNCDDFSGYQEH